MYLILYKNVVEYKESKIADPYSKAGDSEEL